MFRFFITCLICIFAQIKHSHGLVYESESKNHPEESFSLKTRGHSVTRVDAD